MPSRKNKIAIPKFTVLELMVIDNYPVPVELLVLHELNLKLAASFRNVGRNVNLLKV